MLRSLYALLDYSLAASDGVQGAVQDFLIDDETWVVHYLVAETASAVGNRKVLLYPFMAGRPDWEKKRLPVRLTCEQIRTSPPLESDLPVSHKHESGFKGSDAHLRSLQELRGYSVQATDGEIGVVEDMIVEDLLWGVQSVVVSLRRAPGRRVLMPPEAFVSVSSRSKVAWTKASLEVSETFPAFDATAPVNHGPEHSLFDYYGRPIFVNAGSGFEGPEMHRR